MNGRINCLIVEKDPEAVRHIDVLSRKLGTIEVRWKTGSIETGFDILRKHHPEIAVIGIDSDAEAAVASIAAMSREFPSLYLLALSGTSDSDLILRTIRAGARDFLRKPVKEIELSSAAEKVSKLKAGRQEQAGGGGKIVSVFSAKGGNGTTTIAVNLADALARHHGKKVAVIDLVFAHGDVTTFFNVKPSYSILDLAKNAEKADHDFLHSLMVRHSSGVYLLADPPEIEDAEQISAGQVKQVLAALRSMFDVVVVDTPHQFDERTLTALEMSDVILLVSLLNLPSLKNSRKCLDLFRRVGMRDERIRLVVSRYLPDDEISKENVEGVLNCPVFFAVPNDYRTVISSINRGRLLSEVAADKEVTKSFEELAGVLLGPAERKPEPQEKRGLIRRLFRAERSTG